MPKSAAIAAGPLLSVLKCLCTIGFSASIGGAPLLDFPFDEGMGLQTSDTVTGAVGILGDGIDSAKGPLWVTDSPTGNVGDFALAFNRTRPPPRRIHVDLSGTPILLSANKLTNYTLQAWVKLPVRLNSDLMTIYRTAGPSPRVSLSINHNRALHTSVYGNTDFASSVLIPNDNRWHHVAAAMENNYGRIRFYLDGISRQVIDRTATGIATDSGPPDLLIGVDDENNYFNGYLDRVRIDNTDLTVTSLDYPSVRGRPTLASMNGPRPSEIVADIGMSVSFDASPEGLNAQIYWMYRSTLAGPNEKNLPDAVMALPRVFVMGVKPADRGFYSMVASNEHGVTESYASRLEVRTEPGLLQPLWAIQPGEREYITGWNTVPAKRDLERGMAYNPKTDHLLIDACQDTDTIRGIYILDAQTGAHVGSLQDAQAVNGGTIVLTRVVVADDGAIYACNLGTFSDVNPLKIYRWASESAPSPTLAYQGSPSSGMASAQWGKNMVIRGSGANSQILMDSHTALLALFTTINGENFAFSPIRSDAFDDSNIGLAWGEGDTFWGKGISEPLYQWDLDRPTQTSSLKRMFPDFPGDTFMNFGFSEDHAYMVGLNVQVGRDAVELYNTSDLTRAPVLLDSVLFTSDHENDSHYGNTLISKNRIFALNPNNGVAAFAVTPPDPNFRPTLSISLPGNIVLTWPKAFRGWLLESTETLTNPNWTIILYSQINDRFSATVEPTGVKYFRLRK